MLEKFKFKNEVDNGYALLMVVTDAEWGTGFHTATMRRRSSETAGKLDVIWVAFYLL